MNDASFKKLLRSALAMSMASPALIIAASCGGSTSDGVTAPAGTNTTSPSPTTTPSPTGNPTTPTPTGTATTPIPPIDSGVVDAAKDAGPDKCGKAKLPQEFTCSRYAQIPCDVTIPDSGSFPQEDCQKMCPGNDGGVGPGGNAFFCNVAHDDNKEPYLACHYCVIGRRPEGLAPVPRASGTSIGAYFADASHLEAASVEAFEALGAELASLNAPASLLARAERAARDEVRHARTTAKLARRFGAEQGDWSAPPRVNTTARSLEQIALENAVEGCVRETFGALTGMWQAENASDPTVRAAMRAIAEDELRHAALAWSVAAWLRPQLDAETNTRVDEAMREAIDQLAHDVAAEPPTELVDQVGLPTAQAAKTLIASLDEVLWSQAA